MRLEFVIGAWRRRGGNEGGAAATRSQDALLPDACFQQGSASRLQLGMPVITKGGVPAVLCPIVPCCKHVGPCTETYISVCCCSTGQLNTLLETIWYSQLCQANHRTRVHLVSFPPLQWGY